MADTLADVETEDGAGPFARPYRSHKFPACDFCHRRKSRCIRTQVNKPCSLCRSRQRDCITSSSERTGTRRSITSPESSRTANQPLTTTSPPSATEANESQQTGDEVTLGVDGVETAPVTTPSTAPVLNQSGHIVGPALARDAQMLEQYISPRHNTAISHVRPNPYSVFSDDPRNPVVYLKVPRQRSITSPGNGTSGFRQCETIDKIVEPLGPSLFRLYFDVVHPPFPILDEAAVMKAYQQAVLPHTLVCEIYAVSLVFWNLSAKISATSRPPPDVRYIWNLTVSAMHEDFHSPSFSTVLACILDLLGRPITSITYNAINVGSVVALAQSLGLNRNPSSWNLDPRQKTLRIKTWWGLLIHDYWASLCHGTPNHIHREQWDVPLPELEALITSTSARSSPVFERNLRGAESFIALCQLTNILGEVLPLIYSLRKQTPDYTMKMLRRLDTFLDDWQDSLPEWLNPTSAEFQRQQPGSLNLQLSFLAIKMCMSRLALQATRMGDHDEAQYHQARCRKAGNSLIDFVISLTEHEIWAFWLPYTAYHFMSAATLMMRCALEAQVDSVARDCVTSTRALIDYLRMMKTKANWDLADICLGQCETTVKQMSEGDTLEFRRHNHHHASKDGSSQAGKMQKRSSLTQNSQAHGQTPFPPDIDSNRIRNNHIIDDAAAPNQEDMTLQYDFMEQANVLGDWQTQVPENFYFPELWQISHSNQFTT